MRLKKKEESSWPVPVFPIQVGTHKHKLSHIFKYYLYLSCQLQSCYSGNIIQRFIDFLTEYNQHQTKNNHTMKLTEKLRFNG